VAAGLSQEELAERAGWSVRAITDLERGARRVPRKDTVHLLATALALPARERSAFEAAARRRLAPSSALPPLAPPAQTGGTLPPLVGRAGELALLERHLTGEGPPVLLLAGKPGIGRSRLLHEAARRAAERGWQVVRGGCTRRGSQEPYAPLPGALERYLRHRDPLHVRADLHGCAWLVRLLPELAEGPVEPLPAWTLTPDQERRLMVRAQHAQRGGVPPCRAAALQ
jgi:transcriptional regulator with XRE-family HTH domain